MIRRFFILAALACFLPAAAFADTQPPPPDCVTGAVLNNAVNISGTTNPGDTLTAVASISVCGEAVTITYQWSTGETGSSHVVSTADQGTTVSVTVQGHDIDGDLNPVSAAIAIPSAGGGTGGGGTGGGGTGGGGTGDADGDGILDSVDNCISVYNPNQADSDGDHIGDVCDPTPFVGGIAVGNLTQTGGYDLTPGPSESVAGCKSPARLKYREYRQEYRQSVASLTFVAMKVSYQVCYKSSGIVWFHAFAATADYQLVPWNWQSANDNGFPTSVNNGSNAIGHWQGSAAICAFGYACASSVHPSVTIKFFPNNTEAISANVG